MLVVVIPLIVLFAIATIKAIPVIGGDVRIALVASGASAWLLGDPSLSSLGVGIVDGVDTLAWVMCLSLFGAIYAESQVRLGTMDAVLGVLRRVFGNSPRGLIAATFVTLTLAGSLLGDAIAAATVIGFLVIRALAELKIPAEAIAMIILVGASIGSVMPPISQAVFLSASLLGIEPGPVANIAYATVAGSLVLVLLQSFRYVRGRSLPAELIPTESLGAMLRRTWPVFGPLTLLALIVVLDTGFSVNLFALIPGGQAALAFLDATPILRGFSNLVVLAIVAATLVSLLYPRVGKDVGSVVATGVKNVRGTLLLQLCAGFMVGMFQVSGAIDAVAGAAEGLSGNTVALGAVVVISVLGMITGSQTTAQTVVVPFAGPLLVAAGGGAVTVALGASHIASGAQNLPPVGLTAFVVCGLVGATLNRQVDPVKTMVLALPNSLYFIIVGLLFWLFG